MGEVIREPGARTAEAHGEVRAADVRGEGRTDGVVHVGGVQRAVSEVPDAVPEFVTAGIERARGDVEVADRLFRVPSDQVRRRVDLHGDAGEVLGDGIVEFDGEAGAFFGFEPCAHVSDLLTHKFVPLARYKASQDDVPDEDDGDDGKQRPDDGE